jgi:O-antigen ligase
MPRSERLILGLFAAFGGLLALSPGKLPAFGVSATAPLFAWIALEAAARGTLLPATRWTALAAAFWFGLFCSLAFNVTFGDLGAVGWTEVILLLRYGFWMAVFLVTAAVTARARWVSRLTAWLAVAAVALSVLRLANAAVGSGLWMHQNEYGLRFSAFLPFLAAGGLMSGAGIPVAIGAAAVLLNGSRSSWVALAAALGALLFVRMLAGQSVRKPVLALAGVPVALAATAWFAPAALSRPVAARWESFAHLATDKPFQARLALVEKGARLFAAQPLFGAGLGRFDMERVELAGARAPWTNDAVFNHRSSHNAYVGLLAETGLAGAVAFAALLALLLGTGARAAYRLTRRGEAWAGPVWASALALSVHLWALAGLTGTLPWFVFGLTAGMIERERLGTRA